MMARPGVSPGDEIGGRAPEAVVRSCGAAQAKQGARSPKQTQLVLLPGTLCDERVFEPLLSQLPRVEPLILSVSNGASTAEIAGRLLDRTPPRFALAGFSLGGMVALEMAALAPERLAGLALLNTSPLAVPTEAHGSRREAAAQAARIGLKAYVRQTLWPQYVAPGASDRDDLRDLVAEMAEDIGPAVFAAQTEVALSRTDRRPALRQFASPTLLLTGEHDGFCPPSPLRELARTLPSARLAILPDVGHFALLEAPDEVGLQLARWLDDIQTNEVEADASLDRQDRRRR